MKKPLNILYRKNLCSKNIILTSWINYHSHKFRIPQLESQIQPIHPREVEHR